MTSGPKGGNAVREVMVMVVMMMVMVMAVMTKMMTAMMWTMTLIKKKDLSEKAYLRVGAQGLAESDYTSSASGTE